MDDDEKALELVFKLLFVCRQTAAKMLNAFGAVVPFACTIDVAGDVRTEHAGDNSIALPFEQQIDGIHARLRQVDLTKFEAIAVVSHMALSATEQFIAVQMEDADNAFAVAYPCRKRFLRGWTVDDEGDRIPDPIAPLMWSKAFEGRPTTAQPNAEGSQGWLRYLGPDDDPYAERVFFTPSLVSTLARAERLKGGALTKDEVHVVRHQAPHMIVPAKQAQAAADQRGYSDIGPDRCWESWQFVREEAAELDSEVETEAERAYLLAGQKAQLERAAADPRHQGGPACPTCGQPLRTAKARQCFACGAKFDVADGPT